MLLEEQTNTGTCASLLEKQLCALSIQNPSNCFELKTVTGTIIEKKKNCHSSSNGNIKGISRMNQLGNISIRVSLTDVNIIKLDSMTGLSSIPGLVNTGEQKRTWLSLKLKKDNS